MANAAKATQQKWKGIESKAKALAKQANKARESAQKLAMEALKQAQKAQRAYGLRNLKRRPKVSDLTPAQIVHGLGACNGHHTAGLPDDPERAWGAADDSQKQWVLSTVRHRMGAAQRRRFSEGRRDSFSWAEISKLIAKVIDYGRALAEDGSEKDFDSAIRDTLAFDPDY